MYEQVDLDLSRPPRRDSSELRRRRAERGQSAPVEPHAPAPQLPVPAAEALGVAGRERRRAAQRLVSAGRDSVRADWTQPASGRLPCRSRGLVGGLKRSKGLMVA